MIDKIDFNAKADGGWVRVEVSLGPMEKKVDMRPDEALNLSGKLNGWKQELGEATAKAKANADQTDLEGEPVEP